MTERETPLEFVVSEPAGEPMPPGLLAELRRIDGEVARLRSLSDALLRGFLAGAGIDLADSNVNFDLDSGEFTVTALEMAD